MIILGIRSEVNAFGPFHRKINQWKNNRYDGLWITWSDTLKKKVESKGRYREGREYGVWRHYYEDGILRKKERYNRRGISTKYFYPDGKLKSKGKARVEYEGMYLHYYYQGKWTYFSEDGKVDEVITYEKGKEVSDKNKAGSKKE